jgi:hypothetical protein
MVRKKSGPMIVVIPTHLADSESELDTDVKFPFASVCANDAIMVTLVVESIRSFHCALVKVDCSSYVEVKLSGLVRRDVRRSVA